MGCKRLGEWIPSPHRRKGPIAAADGTDVSGLTRRAPKPTRNSPPRDPHPNLEHGVRDVKREVADVTVGGLKPCAPQSSISAKSTLTRRAARLRTGAARRLPDETLHATLADQQPVVMPSLWR